MQRYLVAFAVVLCGTPAFGQPCTPEKLVGTWERVSLLRNALSVQPPDAPLFVTFGADGYWSMMEMPDDRPKIDTPLAQQTAQELFSRFDKVEGGQGTWTVKADGSIVTRKHLVNPNQVGVEQVQQFTLEGDTLALRGTNAAGGKAAATFRRLKPLETVAK